MKADDVTNNPADSQPETVLKPAYILSSTAAEEVQANISYREQQVVTSQTEMVPHVPELSENIEKDLEDPLKPQKKTRKWWVLGALLVIGLSVAEIVVAIAQVISTHDWLGAGWLVVLLLLVITVLVIGVKELRSLKHLKLQAELRERSADLFNTPAIGVGQQHCEQIAKQLPVCYQPFVSNWRNSLESHFTNHEVLSLFELTVLQPIDKAALGNITKHASASGVMIAVSPFALLDMLIVLWRNIVMINQLSKHYGVSLSYWGRIALIKTIFRNMLYAGAAEIISDAGNYALGVGLSGKISSRVAQGLGAGVLTGRIGLKALNECRPMPWLRCTKPGLSHLTTKLVNDLNKYVKQ